MNIDCPWLYERKKAEQKYDYLEGLRMLVEDLDMSDDDVDGRVRYTSLGKAQGEVDVLPIFSPEI